MRTLLFGGLAGLVTSGASAWIVSTTDAVPLSDKITAVVLVAVVTATLVWLVGAVAAFRRWFRGALQRRRVRKQRRRDLAVVRASDRANEPTFDSGADDETVRVERHVARRSAPPQRPRKQAPVSRSRITGLVNEAEALARRGDFRGAVDLFSDAIDASPDHLQAHLARGRIHLDLGDYNRAMSDFVVAEDLAPDSSEPPIAIGELYFARKDYARAIGCFDVALELAPDHAMAHCRRGLSWFYRKNYPLALEDLLRARSIDPDIPNLASHIAATERKVKEEKPGAKKRR